MADIIYGLRNDAAFSEQLSERAAESSLDADEIADYRGQHLRASSLLDKMLAYRPGGAGANQAHTVQVRAQDIAMMKSLLLRSARSLHFAAEDEDEPARSQQRERASRMPATHDRPEAHRLPRAARATRPHDGCVAWGDGCGMARRGAPEVRPHRNAALGLSGGCYGRNPPGQHR